MITTIDQATQAFSAMLRGGAEFQRHLRELEQADADLVTAAGAATLIAEARSVLGEKGWTQAEVRAALSKRGLDGRSRATVEAALASPGDVAAVLHGSRADRTGVVLDVFLMMDFLRRLPTLPPTHTPHLAVDDEQTRLHGKVRALLAKAESTPFEGEAAACTAKAQELMARYAIDEATVRTGDRTRSAATPTSVRVIVEAPYEKPKFVLLSVVARSNRCRSVWLRDYGFATVFGTPADLWSVDLLYTSLLVQAAAAMQHESERSRSFRHAFLVAFADRIGERLREGTTSAMAAATAASGEGFFPVLRAREDAVIAARDAAFPDCASLRVSWSSGSGVGAGRSAANLASLTSERRLEGSRAAVGPTT